MIVQPDFLDHWKTQALIAATSDSAAPLMVLRLWGHCQQRRASKFKNMSAIALAGICRWSKDPEQFLGILKACGFIEVKNDVLIVHDWEQVNASLIVRWVGGENNRRRLLGKPKLSHTLPTRLAGSDKSRVEKSREEKSTPPLPPSKGGNGIAPNLVPTAEDIYNVYPRKVARTEAIKAIQKCIPRYGGSLLLERTLAYAKTQPKNDNFTPYPATWFHRESFNDDPATWLRKDYFSAEKSRPKKYVEFVPPRELTEEELETHRQAMAKTKAAVAGLTNTMGITNAQRRSN